MCVCFVVCCCPHPPSAVISERGEKGSLDAMWEMGGGWLAVGFGALMRLSFMYCSCGSGILEQITKNQELLFYFLKISGKAGKTEKNRPI